MVGKPNLGDLKVTSRGSSAADPHYGPLDQQRAASMADEGGTFAFSDRQREGGSAKVLSKVYLSFIAGFLIAFAFGNKKRRTKRGGQFGHGS